MPITKTENTGIGQEIFLSILISIISGIIINIILREDFSGE